LAACNASRVAPLGGRGGWRKGGLFTDIKSHPNDSTTQRCPSCLLHFFRPFNMPPTPSMPQTFIHKKAAILQSLSVPASSYSDKSPKGTVDDGIRELIGEINAYEGFVTTSSCAGRVSVFLEGSGRAGNGKDEVGSLSSRNANVPGGKGGGEFLFVAHEPVQISEKAGLLQQLLPGIFGQGDGGDRVSGSESWVPGERFVRFAFEPMVRRKPGLKGTR